MTRDLGVASALLQVPRALRPPLVYESHGYSPDVAAAMPAPACDRGEAVGSQSSSGWRVAKHASGGMQTAMSRSLAACTTRWSNASGLDRALPSCPTALPQSRHRSPDRNAVTNDSPTVQPAEASIGRDGRGPSQLEASGGLCRSPVSVEGRGRAGRGARESAGGGRPDRRRPPTRAGSRALASAGAAPRCGVTDYVCRNGGTFRGRGAARSSDDARPAKSGIGNRHEVHVAA